MNNILFIGGMTFMAIIKTQVVIRAYETDSGKAPFQKWYNKLDRDVRNIIRIRLARIRIGNFGECECLVGSDNLWEIKFREGPGYRIYYAKIGIILIMLLCGGDKSTQISDILKAKKYWNDAKLRGYTYDIQKEEQSWLDRL